MVPEYAVSAVLHREAAGGERIVSPRWVGATASEADSTASFGLHSPPQWVDSRTCRGNAGRPQFRAMLRSLLLCWIFLAALAGLRAADVELLRVWPGWQEAESFDRIAEYFGGGERSGRQSVLRTRPAVREGYYFLVRIKSAQPVPAAKFEVQVIRPDATEPKTFTFAAAVPAKETVFQLGLTGPDWPGGAKVNPVAWKLAVLGADGQVLAEHKSFLWEKPAP